MHHIVYMAVAMAWAIATLSCMGRETLHSCKPGAPGVVNNLDLYRKAVLYTRFISRIGTCSLAACASSEADHLAGGLWLQDGIKPLYLAAAQQHVAVAELLLKAGAKAAAADKVSVR
jgi:hypothetical protein